MKRALFFISVILFSFSISSGQNFLTDSVSVAPFGKVHLYYPKTGPAQNLIVLISGDGGWKSGVPEFAKEFSRMNYVVAGVDILYYYRQIRQRTAECYTISSDFVELATAVEHKYNFASYVPPLIMGYSSGATLVYAILSQARPGTFIGGISLGFCPDIELPKMLCQLNGLQVKELVKNKSFLLLPDARLGNPWMVLHGKKDKVCDLQTVKDFILNTAEAKLITLPEVGHGFSKWSDFMPQWKSACNELISNYNSNSIRNTPVAELSKIPYNITRKEGTTGNNIFALLFSGDGGWYAFEQNMANRMSALGIPVIGIDTKKYFWNRRTPEKTASDVADLLRFYGKEWNLSRYMLIGYSQGAELVPFIYNRLPDEIREKVTSVVMLSPQTSTDFEVHISNMLDLGNRQNTFNVIDEISGIKNTRQIIIFGDGEKTRVPDLLKYSGAQIVKIPGDHHYKNNTGLIVQTLKDCKLF